MSVDLDALYIDWLVYFYVGWSGCLVYWLTGIFLCRLIWMPVYWLIGIFYVGWSGCLVYWFIDIFLCRLIWMPCVLIDWYILGRLIWMPCILIDSCIFRSVDLGSLYNELEARLPSYARPIFIRLVDQIEITGGVFAKETTMEIWQCTVLVLNWKGAVSLFIQELTPKFLWIDKY